MNHLLLEKSLHPPFPASYETAYFAMGCFWGAERLFWSEKGVYVTAVGYSGGQSENPTYLQVCTGETGHTETVMVVFDPAYLSYSQLLKLFWESHDPTQGMRQGNDVGSQYRSAIFCTSTAQLEQANQSSEKYQFDLNRHSPVQDYSSITTTISRLDTFWLAEAEHQQYLFRNPNGYCGLKGTGIVCSV